MGRDVGGDSHPQARGRYDLSGATVADEPRVGFQLLPAIFRPANPMGDNICAACVWDSCPLSSLAMLLAFLESN